MGEGHAPASPRACPAQPLPALPLPAQLSVADSNRRAPAPGRVGLGVRGPALGSPPRGSGGAGCFVRHSGALEGVSSLRPLGLLHAGAEGKAAGSSPGGAVDGGCRPLARGRRAPESRLGAFLAVTRLRDRSRWFLSAQTLRCLRETTTVLHRVWLGALIRPACRRRQGRNTTEERGWAEESPVRGSGWAAPLPAQLRLPVSAGRSSAAPFRDGNSGESSFVLFFARGWMFEIFI